MTPIFELPPAGPEMDRLIAGHVFGWVVNERSPVIYPWSTCRECTWDVVDELRARDTDLFCEIYSGVPEPASRYDPGRQWTCRFVRRGELLGYGTSESVAEAVCIAALRTKLIL